MADPFVAEIRIFPFNFQPKGWAWCDGQLLPLSQNTALFALLGTFYGGNGKSNFALPDLQGASPINQGQGGGLSDYFIGQSGGEETHTLLESEMPAHTHSVMAANFPADIKTPTPNTALARSTGGNAYQNNTSSNLVPMNGSSLPPAGSSLPHNNMMPYLTFYFCIALQGVFPARG